ncbi:MAG: acetate--CoA ligase family protein [Deltaproteobacteria bacterium]|nr:acetate--CoA ligase family protein [Deltaproteobacteria bacterium]
MLESLFEPRTIAVIGASTDPGKVGHALFANLQAGGFEGTLVPVNTSADEVCGASCFRSIRAYPGPVDLAVVCVQPLAVEDAVRDAIAKGVGAIVVVTSGFREVGPEGAAMELRLTELARRHHVRLLGPNVVGLVNTRHRMNASFALEMPSDGPISVIAQSGAICTVILDWAKGRGIGLGKLVSIGNKADLTEVDFLRALAVDPHTKVIVGYVEDIRQGAEFIRAAEAAAAEKPVVLLKAGTSEAGKRAASSHTGSLGGADIAYGAAFARAGVIRAATFEDLLDFATAFSMQPLPSGQRVAVVTNAGGLGILAADAVEEAGMEVAALSGETLAALAALLPPAAALGDPVDVLGDASAERYAEAVRLVAADPGVDALVVLFAPQAMTAAEDAARAVASAQLGDKPVLAAFMGGAAVLPGRAVLVQRGIPDYPSAERAVRSLRAMWGYAQWRSRPPRVVERFPVNKLRVQRILNRHIRLGRAEVGEVEAKQILRAYDFVVPEGAVARTVEDAVDIAQRVGFPVAMKIVSPDIVHKSDVGGVRVGLSGPDEVRDAYDLMMLRVSRQYPHAALEGVNVEAMAPAGREVIIGMSRDPRFGPMLMFGLGGIFVEVMKDVTFHLAPITAQEAMEMLESTRSYGLLKGARGQREVDMAAIASGIQRISQLATDFPMITELDINPFIVGPRGTGGSAADARMSLNLGGDR